MARIRHVLLSALASATIVAARLAPRQAATTATPTSTTATTVVTAISECHLHSTEVFCFAGTAEYSVAVTPTATTDIPAEYTGCHTHGQELFCVLDGNDVEVHPVSETEEDHDHNHEEEETTQGENCHYHGNVLHCDNAASANVDCSAARRDYNVGLRIGMLFVVLATSALGVFGPILLSWILPDRLSTVLLVLKQFGTGIIISTAFVHLFTHASMMFNSECLGGLSYEATTAAIVMAGLFLSFLVEYIGQRILLRQIKSKTSSRMSTDIIGIVVMEIGILFHSILIGLTLVVTPDDNFAPLLVVIIFHQIFEGIALGTRIAAVRMADPAAVASAPASDTPSKISADGSEVAQAAETRTIPLPLWRKLGLAALFALITPIGMAIGIGVLDNFNSNDRETLIAIGTLDALSAGILIWVGVVEMWAHDWMAGTHAHGHASSHGGELADAGWVTGGLAMFGLVAGMALMSLLGKWA